MTGLLGYRHVLIVTAVEPERAAVWAGLRLSTSAASEAGGDPATSDGPAAGGTVAGGPTAGGPTASGPTASGPTAGGGPATSSPTAGGAIGGLAVDGVELALIGVGPALAAATTARLRADAEHAGRPYDAVICAGIAGGFAGRVEVGGLAIATESIAADLGADSPDGFIGLDELGFGSARRPTGLGELLHKALPEAAAGPILSVSTVTGTAAGAKLLTGRHPDAVAEGMEGFGVACAAGELPFGEIRAISNVVGPRDRAAWRIAPALGALETAFRRLTGATLER